MDVTRQRPQSTMAPDGRSPDEETRRVATDAT